MLFQDSWVLSCHASDYMLEMNMDDIVVFGNFSNFSQLEFLNWYFSPSDFSQTCTFNVEAGQYPLVLNVSKKEIYEQHKIQCGHQTFLLMWNPIIVIVKLSWG